MAAPEKTGTKDLKAQLLARLREIDGLECRPSPVVGGQALFYRGKPLAHFHDDHELDLRLTRKVIAAQGLLHPAGSIHHPERSANSPWIEIRFAQEQDLDRVCKLVLLATAQR